MPIDSTLPIAIYNGEPRDGFYGRRGGKLYPPLLKGDKGRYKKNKFCDCPTCKKDVIAEHYRINKKHLEYSFFPFKWKGVGLSTSDLIFSETSKTTVL